MNAWNGNELSHETLHTAVYVLSHYVLSRSGMIAASSHNGEVKITVEQFSLLLAKNESSFPCKRCLGGGGGERK